MKITGSRSFILVEFEHKAVKIMGELTTEPAFYAELKSIKNWEPPYENVSISEEEKDDIVKRIIEETKDKDFKIYFE